MEFAVWLPFQIEATILTKNTVTHFTTMVLRAVQTFQAWILEGHRDKITFILSKPYD